MIYGPFKCIVSMNVLSFTISWRNKNWNLRNKKYNIFKVVPRSLYYLSHTIL